MPTYTYCCDICGHVTDAHFRLSETRPETVQCEECGELAEYQLAAPMVLKASYLDGQRRRQFQDLREASKLNVAAAGEDNLDKKRELKKEARKIGYNLSTDPD